MQKPPTHFLIYLLLRCGMRSRRVAGEKEKNAIFSFFFSILYMIEITFNHNNQTE